MQDIVDFLEERKTQYLKRAENCEEQIQMFERAYKNNEKYQSGNDQYYDMHSREQMHSVISKKNELLGKVELIEELQEKYGF